MIDGRVLPLQAWCDCNAEFIQGIVAGGVYTLFIVFLFCVIIYFLRYTRTNDDND